MLKYIVMISFGIVLAVLVSFLANKNRTINYRYILIYMAICVCEIVSAFLLAYKFGLRIYSLLMLVYIAEMCLISVGDIAEHLISRPKIYGLLFTGLMISFFVPGVSFWIPILTAVVIGGALYLVSVKSKEAIGKGDVFCIASTALCFPLSGFFNAVIYTLIAGLIYGLFGVFFKKKGIKQAIPFAPCLVFGIILTLFYI